MEHLLINGGGEEPEQALVVEDSEVFVGGTISVLSTYKSPNGPTSYHPEISATVFINGRYEGEATKMPRTPPLPGQEDPGQSFIFETKARGVGNYEVEFLIINGDDETSTATANITISESPLTDDYLFLTSLWNGMFDRDPQAFEISKFLRELSVGSITRAQSLDSLQVPKSSFRQEITCSFTKLTLGNGAQPRLFWQIKLHLGSQGGGSSGASNARLILFLMESKYWKTRRDRRR